MKDRGGSTLFERALTQLSILRKPSPGHVSNPLSVILCFLPPRCLANCLLVWNSTKQQSLPPSRCDANSASGGATPTAAEGRGTELAGGRRSSSLAMAKAAKDAEVVLRRSVRPTPRLLCACSFCVLLLFPSDGIYRGARIRHKITPPPPMDRFLLSPKA